MRQTSGPLLTLLLIVPLAAAASFLAAKAALPPEDAPALLAPSDGLADIRARLDEIDRQLGYMDQRLEAAETTAARARDLAEALRDRRPPGSSTEAAAPAPAGVAAPSVTAPGAAGPDGRPDLSQMTDEQLREARVRQIQDAVRTGMRTAIPARLMELASTEPGVADRRRANARVEAQQMAITLACSGEEADKLREIYFDHLDREVREVGPLVRNGMDRADLAAVESRLSEGWTEVDRRAKEVLGEVKFQKFAENAGAMRTLTREVLADLRKR